MVSRVIQGSKNHDIGFFSGLMPAFELCACLLCLSALKVTYLVYGGRKVCISCFMNSELINF